MGRGTDLCTRCNSAEWSEVAEELGGICAECAAAEIKRLQANLHHCRGLLETAVDAMETNGTQRGITLAWLEAARDAAGGGDE